mmetsp:Transcript_4619/g.622  ORF Transcript_4619/g.622 Transcript_4619/m.622 type:complete len:90 (-) Transcript_4619:34-303(-)
MLLAIWNSFSIPVFIAFEPEIAADPGMVACDFIIDFCFMLDIILNFRTSFISVADGKEIMNPKMIASNYIKQGPFAIDLLSTIPVDNIA